MVGGILGTALLAPGDASCQLQVHNTASSSPEHNLTIRVGQHVIYVFSLASPLRILTAMSDSDPSISRDFVCQCATVVARQIIWIAFELNAPQHFCYLVVVNNYSMCAVTHVLGEYGSTLLPVGGPRNPVHFSLGSIKMRFAVHDLCGTCTLGHRHFLYLSCV